MLKPTNEQQSILDSSGRIIKVAAFAGTGKSSTLVFLANRYPDKKILYIAFNKSVVNESKGKFPSNTTVTTGHGLAYRAMAAPYKHKLVGTLKPYELVALECLTFPKRSVKETRNIMADGALKVLTFFMQTSVEKIGDISTQALHDDILKPIHLSCGSFSFYLNLAKELWMKMTDPESLVPFVHSAYVKLFQLSKPVFRGYDIIALDEAQDTSDVLYSIIKRQTHLRIFYIGDSHQSIYGYLNSCNLMEIVRADESFSLTGSFRFGQEIANAANIFLHGYKGEKKLIRGLGPNTKVLEAKGTTIRNNHAYLARTNAGIFEKASMAAKAGFDLRFIGGVGSYKLGLIVDAFHFSRGGKPFSNQLKHFNSFQEMKETAKALEDMELSSLVGLIIKMGKEIPESAKKIKEKAVSGRSKSEREVVLTTAHRSKGLEFDHGEMANDFAKLYDPDELTEEEVNLMYVAVTRFKETARLPEVVMDSLNAAGKQ